MQTCPEFFLKSLLESPGNLLEICLVRFVDTLYVSFQLTVIPWLLMYETCLEYTQYLKIRYHNFWTTNR